jgi:hypothetical protein
MANHYQLPWHPNSGQALLYIEFAEVENKTVTEVLNVLEKMGYQPELRYRETVEGIELHALLREEQQASGHTFPDDHWFDDMMALYEAFQPYEKAIHCQRGLPVPVAAVA